MKFYGFRFDLFRHFVTFITTSIFIGCLSQWSRLAHLIREAVKQSGVRLTIPESGRGKIFKLTKFIVVWKFRLEKLRGGPETDQYIGQTVYVYLSIYILSFIYLIYPSIYLSIHLSIYLSIHLSINLKYILRIIHYTYINVFLY